MPIESLPGTSILQRDGFRCVACGFPLRPTLAVHHIIPKSLGGRDNEENLRTLCTNCHRLVHWLSVGRRLEGHAAEELTQVLSPSSLQVLRLLARRIRQHRQHTQLAGNSWVQRGSTARGSIKLTDALDLIALRNGVESTEKVMLKRIVQRVIRSIPRRVREECSYRLVRDGRYLSVNAGNHLVFRTPAYSDDGKRQEADLYLIWPQSTRISVVSQSEWKRVSTGRFAAIPCFNIALNFEDAFSLRPDEWRTFGQSCYDALYVRRTRRWVSNVSLD